MIAGKSFRQRQCPTDFVFDRRQRHLYDEFAVQEAGLERRSSISNPRVALTPKTMGETWFVLSPSHLS